MIQTVVVLISTLLFLNANYYHQVNAGVTYRSPVPGFLPEPHHACLFPFIIQQSLYTTCVSDQNATQYWCSPNRIFNGTKLFCHERKVVNARRRDEYIHKPIDRIRLLQDQLTTLQKDNTKMKSDIARQNQTIVSLHKDNMIMKADNANFQRDTKAQNQDLRSQLQQLMQHPILAPRGNDDREHTESCERFKGVDYLYVLRDMTYDSAEMFCLIRGGHLAAPTDEATNDYVTGFITDGRFYFGLNKRNTKDLLTFTSGVPVTYTNLASPNKEVGKDCYRMRSTDNKWHASDCEMKLPFICELRNFNYCN